MNPNSIHSPLVSTVEEVCTIAGIPEVTGIVYDLWTLRITLSFENVDSPVYLVFEDVRGFRVLDEGDLNEFWNPQLRAEGWLWNVSRGGWLDLEKLRSGFVSGISGVVDEYLVLGINDCISVLSATKPSVFTVKP